MRIGFVGAGAMASAIITGICQAGAVHPADILVTSARGSSSANLATNLGVTACASNLDLVSNLDDNSLLFLAAKPYQIPQILEQIVPALQQNRPTVISLAAGLTMDGLQSLLPSLYPVVRVMPNVNVKVREGMSAVCASTNVKEATLQYLCQLLQTVGDVVEIPEHLFPAFAAIAGSSPAWTAKYIDALATSALSLGIPKDIGVRIASQAVLGTARSLILGCKTGENPTNIVDTVQSPGGTTVAGTIALEKSGFATAVFEAVSATSARDIELSQKHN